MNDREKVIKRLEECLSASCRGFRTCPYSDNEWDAVKTAIALLKEQEAERLDFIETVAKLVAENEVLKKDVEAK